MHGNYRPPIESQLPGVEWSRDRWRHVIPKGQGHDHIIFAAMAMKCGYLRCEKERK